MCVLCVRESSCGCVRIVAENRRIKPCGTHEIVDIGIHLRSCSLLCDELRRGPLSLTTQGPFDPVSYLCVSVVQHSALPIPLPNASSWPPASSTQHLTAPSAWEQVLALREGSHLYRTIDASLHLLVNPSASTYSIVAHALQHFREIGSDLNIGRCRLDSRRVGTDLLESRGLGVESQVNRIIDIQAYTPAGVRGSWSREAFLSMHRARGEPYPTPLQYHHPVRLPLAYPI